MNSLNSCFRVLIGVIDSKAFLNIWPSQVVVTACRRPHEQSTDGYLLLQNYDYLTNKYSSLINQSRPCDLLWHNEINQRNVWIQ